MADAVENPTPRDALVVGQDGKLYFERFDENGQPLRREQASALDALTYLQNLIAFSGSEVPDVPTQRVDGGYDVANVATLPREELKTIIRSLLDRIANDVVQANPNASVEERTQIYAEAIASSVIDPKAIRVVAEVIAERSPAILVRIWPNGADALARPGDPDTEWQTPSFTGGPSRAMEGTASTGPGGPPSPSPSATIASGGAATSASHAADPVLPFTGQFHLEATDLTIDGIGLNLEFKRTYLHGARHFGPLGPRWDHSYNLWLREALEPHAGGGYDHVVYRSTGSLRVDRFRAASQNAAFDVTDVTDAEFIPPDGEFDRLRKRGGRFVVTTQGGLEIQYDDNLRAETLRDLNGNEIRLIYDTAVDRLDMIRDTCGREIQLQYDDGGHLVHLVDRSLDRHVWYRYDEDGRLNAVWKSVGSGEDPILTAGYRYWGDGAPRDLDGNIVGVIDGRGREVLQLRYGDEPGFIWYDRVVEQRDGGITSFEYEFVTDDDEDDRLNVGFVRCRVTLPSGDVQSYDYNRLGRMVRLTVDDADPLNPPRLVTRWRYNVDGNAVMEERPDGSSVEYVYQREVYATLQDPATASIDDRVAFGRLRRIVERRTPGTSVPPTRVTEFDYDDRFGLISETRGPYYGDSFGARVDPGPAWSQRTTFDNRANCVSTRVPDCTLPDGTTQAGGEGRFGYDARGRLVRRAIEASAGEVLATEFRYDPGPNLSSAPIAEIADADGLAIEHTYVVDRGGRMIEALAPTGKRVVHVFDDLGRIRREETWMPGQASAAVQTNEFGPLPLPVRTRLNRVNASGAEEAGAELIEEFSFDAEGDVERSRLSSADGAIDREVRYIRDQNRRLAAHEVAGVRVETVRNSRGLPAELRVTANGVASSRSRSRYDALGRLAMSIDEAGDATEISYDGFGRVRRVRHPSGTQDRFEWNARDSMTRHQVVGAHPDQPGPVLLAEQRQEHDENGRVIRRIELVFDPAVTGAAPVLATTTMTLDRADRLVATTEPDGVRRRYRYDGLSRLIRADDGVASVSTTTYDLTANTSDEETVLTGTASDGTKRTVTIKVNTEYDADGRTIAVTDGLGNRWQWEYDSRGATRAQSDPAGVRTVYNVGADGALDAIVHAAGRPESLTTIYRRDEMRRLIGMAGPRGPVMSLVRDVFGRIESGSSGPESIVTRYDAAGRVDTLTDGTGSITTFGYAPGGLVRTISVTPPQAGVASARAGASAQLQYTYDGGGRLVAANDGVNPVAVRYDSRGLVLSETTANTTARMSYDIAGRVSAFQFPDSRAIAFNRTADGRLQSVDDTPSAGGAISELLRVWTVGSGNIVEQRWRGATARREQADPAGRLLAIDECDAQGTTFFAVRQVTDARGYPTARSLAIGADAEVTVAETDPHGRIVAAAFDQAGPLDVTPIMAAGVAARQTDLDAVLAAVGAALPPDGETLNIQLDPDGARRGWERLQNGAVVEDRQYDVDALGRSVEVGSGRTGDSEGLPMADRGTTCRYDAFRRLSRVERHGALVAALGYDAAGRVATVTTPQGTTRLLYADGGLVEARSGNQVVGQYVRLPGGPLIETGLPASPRRALVDGQGSLVGLADSTGAVTASALCDPFGEVRTTNGTWPAIGPRFQGLLGVNGLDVLLTDVRTYDPRIGAFREIDPAGFPDGLNRGLFADGNPLAFCDPSGLMAQPADMAGRPSATPGVGGMYGDSMLAFRPSERPYNWAERAVLAMGGAMWSVAEGFYQLGAMLYDLQYLALDIDLRAMGIDIDYKAQSGLGQMAQSGQVGWGLDVFRVMGKGLIGTPGRLIDAMERDDPFEVGREAMSCYMVGKPALVGLAKTVFNGGVSALRIGGFRGGLTLNRRIRTWQVRRMQANAEKLAGAQGQPPIAVRYVGRIKAEKGYVALGEYQPARSVILMSDAAFNPVHHLSNLLAGFNPWTFGGSFTSRLGLMWGSVSRGNFALRTLTHEFFHHYQRSTSPSFFKQSGLALDYRLDPAEFTQPGIKAPWPGAWNAELGVPRGPLPVGAFMGLQVGLNSFARPQNETR